MTPVGIVVVGASAAGFGAAEAARRAGYDGQITVIGDEPHPPYARPALSKSLLCGTDLAESVHLPPSDADITFLPGRTAVRLDPGLKRILLSDGDEIEYGSLIIATGARARTLGGDGETVLRSLHDAIRLRELMNNARSAIVIGGGFVGVEVASAAVTAGVDTTIITRHDLLTPAIGSDLGQAITTAAVTAGVRLVQTSLEVAVDRRNGVNRITKPDGSVVADADLIVTAIGCQPNTEWLRGSGLSLDDGIVVDDHCRAAPDIAAAGDVVRVRRADGSLDMRTPFWMAALNQARIAGQSAARGYAADPYEPSPFYWTEAFGLSITVSGPMPTSEVRETLAGDLGEGSGLFRWRSADGLGTATVASVNHKISARKLRTLTQVAG